MFCKCCKTHQLSFTVSLFSWTMGYNNSNGMHIIWDLFHFIFFHLLLFFIPLPRYPHCANADFSIKFPHWMHICVDRLLLLLLVVFFSSSFGLQLHYCGFRSVYSAYFIVMDFHQHLWPLCYGNIYFIIYTQVGDVCEKKCVYKHCY